MKFRPGSVYMLRKTGHHLNGDVKIVAWAYVWDMYAVEKRLHEIIDGFRYGTLKDVKRGDRLRGWLCKIGRTSRPVEARLGDIQKNWKSGHTEWARLPWLLRWRIRMIMMWWTVLPLVIAGSIFIIYLLVNTSIELTHTI